MGGRRGRGPARAAGGATLLALAALAGALLAWPSQSPAQREAVVLPAGTDWNADTRSLRGRTVPSRAEFLCPADGRPGSVWGTDVYTDDSSVCSAAVHAGKITIADGGTVTVETRPGQATYAGSTRNGITTTSYGQWPNSFVIVSAEPGGRASGVRMGGAGWETSAADHRGRNGVRYEYLCPAGGPVSQRVWGTNVYTDDSSVCSAAVHVGVITAAAGGTVTIEIRPGQRSYVGFASNGISSRDYGAWTGSFVLAGAPPIPGSPGPGGGGSGGGGGGGTTTAPTTTTTPGGAAAPPTATPTGTVLVNGQPFTGGVIPFNATVDVTEGTVTLRTDAGTLKVNGLGNGIPAAFVLRRGTDRGRPIVELRLAKGDFGVCKRRRTRSASAAVATTVRAIWGDGKGKFRTRGRYSSATIRGTRWLTSDRCDGTHVRVARGVVGVLDPPRRQEILLRAPRTYLARP